MSKHVLVIGVAVAGLVLGMAGTLHAASPVPPKAATAQASPAVQPRAVVDKYCVGCHNTRMKAGGLVLDKLEINNPANTETWEKVIGKLNAGVMPPPSAPRPDYATYQGLIDGLAGAMDKIAAIAPNPGRPAIHRLNRTEYANAVRDLLFLDIDGKALLPADNSGHGFDNVADVLTVSPGLIERYLLAAKKIARAAIGDASTKPSTTVYNIPYMTLVQDDRMSEDLPFGSRGGVAIKHYFPVDGDYEIQLRVQRNSLNIGNEIRGLDVENHIDVRLDGKRVKVFTMGGRDYGAISYTETEDIADSGLHVRFPAKAGTRVVGVTFNRDQWYVEGVGMSRLPPSSDGYASGRKTETAYGRINMGIDRVDVTGPYNGTLPVDSLSRTRIFRCTPQSAKDENGCARTILNAIARRAYRRPLAAIDTKILMEFFASGRSEGSFDDGIEQGLVRILTDPDFLFRVETDLPGAKPGTNYQVADLDLAARLSFFLWSSVPDDELLDLAAAGTLRQPKVFDAQVQRMLADKKASALVSNFFGQWLLVRNMATVRPDAKAFPEFDENLREAFQQETQLFLESQLREDRPVSELITANYSFLNERLARHYGVPHVYGNHFRRITLPDETNRGGILNHGSVLTVTSYADRTSVVLRGKFILESILGTPPPPPPANVPPLENTKVAGTLRQRMEMHRKNPICANCHAQLDPMGFAFENFNGIGKWRTEDGKARIDSSGSLPDGTKFSGPAGFRDALAKKDNVFITTMTSKLLTYALGRGLEPSDMPVVRQLIHDTEAAGNRWSTLILNITKSTPFQMRRAES
jgi:mono/diheme cytochrome c family protein